MKTKKTKLIAVDKHTKQLGRYYVSALNDVGETIPMRMCKYCEYTNSKFNWICCACVYKRWYLFWLRPFC